MPHSAMCKGYAGLDKRRWLGHRGCLLLRVVFSADALAIVGDEAVVELQGTLVASE